RSRLKARVREFGIIFGQFKRTLIFLAILCITGTIAFCIIQEVEPVEGLYITAGLLTGEIPDYDPSPILSLIGITYPLLGLLVVGEGLIHFGMKIFEKQHRAKEWNLALTRTMNEHTILAGVGHVATRVLEELIYENENIVYIVPDEEIFNELSTRFQYENLAFIIGNPSSRNLLHVEGIKKARAIIACAEEDLHNLKIAIEAKELNPKIRTVARIYDAEFAHKLRRSFDIDVAISTSKTAAPSFVAGSKMNGIIQTIASEKRRDHIAQMKIPSGFQTSTVGKLETEFDVTFISIEREEKREIHLEENDELKGDDIILVLGTLSVLTNLRKYFGI
ncbi:MAG: potassium channel family protein, partial [Candidatus Hodarchaeota archaeon]